MFGKSLDPAGLKIVRCRGAHIKIKLALAMFKNRIYGQKILAGVIDHWLGVDHFCRKEVTG